MFGRSVKAYYALANAINRASDAQKLADHDKYVATKELSETLQKISSESIASKDRVDIPLATYEEMKANIEKLAAEVDRYRTCFRDTPIPDMMQRDINPRDVEVKTYETRDPYRMETKLMYVMKFETTMPIDWRVNP